MPKIILDKGDIVNLIMDHVMAQKYVGPCDIQSIGFQFTQKFYTELCCHHLEELKEVEVAFVRQEETSAS